MTIGVACWRCGTPGHVWSECRQPAARTRKELAARIEFLVAQWVNEVISTSRKREWIAAEVKQFEKARKAA